MKKNILIMYLLVTTYSKITNTERLSKKKVKNRSEQIIIPNNQTIVNNLPLQSMPAYTTN